MNRIDSIKAASLKRRTIVEKADKTAQRKLKT